MKTPDQRLQQISKFLSLVLRHEPHRIGILLDQNGWTNLQELSKKLAQVFPDITLSDIQEIVRTDPKKRYSIQESRVRANQGHSINLDPGTFEPKKPPEFLFHGTTGSAWDLIQKSKAILRMQRHHVHLSIDILTAKQVAARRKSEVSVILRVHAGRMFEAGAEFFLTENGVWLTSSVALEFIEKVE